MSSAEAAVAEEESLSTQEHPETKDSVLNTRPFSSTWLYALWLLSLILVRPFFQCCNYFLAVFIPAEDENRPRLRLLVSIPLFFVLIALGPFAIIGLPLYLLTESKRLPQIYSKFSERHVRPLAQSTFTVISANVGLSPEFVSRRRNMSHVLRRARMIAVRLLAAHVNIARGNSDEAEDTTPPRWAIKTKFPAADFVCFQGIYDRSAEKLIMKLLSKQYPYFVHNVGKSSWTTNHFIMNSGLMLASKYPITHAEFQPFHNALGFERFLSKGVLMVKLLLVRSQPGNDHSTIGYLWLTNLQNTDENIRSRQLEEIGKHTAAFRKATLKPASEQIGFQIMAGDMGFDNVSEKGKQNWDHPVLSRYRDPFSQRPGVDENWCLGTLLNRDHIHAEHMKTPEKMKEALSTPEMVKEMFVWDEEEWRPGLHRVDRLMIKERNPEHQPYQVRQVQYVTALAGLTAHIPLAMEFSIGEHEMGKQLLAPFGHHHETLNLGNQFGDAVFTNRESSLHIRGSVTGPRENKAEATHHVVIQLDESIPAVGGLEVDLDSNESESESDTDSEVEGVTTV